MVERFREPLQIREVPVPSPGPGQALVQIIATGGRNQCPPRAQLALQATLFFIVKGSRELIIISLRNRFQGRCKRAVRRSRRRIGRSCCRRATQNLTKAGATRSLVSARRIGRRATHSFAAAGIRPRTRRTSSRLFSVQLLEQNTLSRADRERGRLRTFLLTSLENFLHKQWERIRAIKRGGKQQMVSFDLHLPEIEAAMLATSDSAMLVPSTCSVGFQHLVTRAWNNVREKCIADGKG